MTARFHPAFAAALLVASGCVSDRPDRQPAGPDADAAQVRIRNFVYVPDPVEVPAGTALVWTNEDDMVHTVTADEGAFDSSTLSRADTFQLSPEEPGTFPYHCDVHPFMHGTLRVIARTAAPGDRGGGGGAPTYDVGVAPARGWR